MTDHSRVRTLARRAGVGAVTGALVTTTLLLTSQAPANAATVAVTPAELSTAQTPYAGWHQGYADSPLNAAITEDGLSLRGKSQVIKGYANNDNANLAANGVNAPLSALLGATYDVTDGTAFFQLALFADADGEAGGAADFSTLRPATGHTGNAPIAGSDLWELSRPVAGIAKNTPTALSTIIDKIDDNPYKTIAFGVLTNIDAHADVKSITFNGDTYTFDAADVVAATVRNADIRPEETSSSYVEWHQGYANAASNHQVTPAGLVLAGRSQVLKGFSNNSDTLNAVNANLQFVLPEASYTVAPGSDPVYFQVPVKYSDAGTTKFATLRNTGRGPGTHGFSLTDTWQSSKALPGVEANTDTPLSTLVAALGSSYKTIGFGVLTNTGEVGTVSSITFGARTFAFADSTPAPGSTTVVPASSIRPDESTYAGWHQGAPGGTATVATDSNVLDLGANRSQVINGYTNNSITLDGRNANLAEVLPQASYTVTGGIVHFQVPMFVENPATGQTVFTTLRNATPVQGTNTFHVGQRWVSSKTIGAFTANEPYLLGDILSAFKTYKVLAFGVYADAGAAGKVTDITWNGVRYTFSGNSSPVAPNVAATTTAGQAVTVNLAATDVDGDTLTYTVAPNPVGGPVSLTGNALRYTPAAGFAGTKRVTYTANDGKGGTKSGTVTIKVTAARTSLTLNSFTGGAKNTFIRVTPSAPGGVVNGATVDIRRGGKAVASGTVTNGFARIKVGTKLKKGTYTYYVYYRGTTTSTPLTKAIKVVIKK